MSEFIVARNLSQVLGFLLRVLKLVLNCICLTFLHCALAKAGCQSVWIYCWEKFEPSPGVSSSNKQLTMLCVENIKLFPRFWWNQSTYAANCAHCSTFARSFTQVFSINLFKPSLFTYLYHQAAISITPHQQFLHLMIGSDFAKNEICKKKISNRMIDAHHPLWARAK